MPNQRRIGVSEDNDPGVVVDGGDGPIELITPVGVNLNGVALAAAIETELSGAYVPPSVYRRVESRAAQFNALTAGLRALVAPGGAAVGSSQNTAAATFYFDPADYAIAGLTTKLRLRASIATNDVDPASNFTVDLAAYSLPTGAANIVSGSLSSYVSGAQVAITDATLTANALVTATSGDFTAPAAGWYAIVVTTSANMTANSAAAVVAALAVRNV